MHSDLLSLIPLEFSLQALRELLCVAIAGRAFWNSASKKVSG